MGRAGVDAALIHPPWGWDPEANAVAIEAARNHPSVSPVMGQFRLDQPENRKLIHGWRKQFGHDGIALVVPAAEHQKWLDDGSLDWLWPAAAKEGAAHRHEWADCSWQIRKIAERHPHLRMIVDHCGLNRHGQDAEAFIHLDELWRWRSCPTWP